MAILSKTACKKISAVYSGLVCCQPGCPDKQPCFQLPALGGLAYCQSERTVKGTLSFCCNHEGRKLTHHHTLCEAPRNAIQDEYKICLDFSNENRTVMRETSQKIEKAYKSKQIDYDDLHVYSDATCCLGLGIDERKMSAYTFIKDYVVPYLYYHSYFFENNEYPWKGLPHNREQAIRELWKGLPHDREQAIRVLEKYIINRLDSILPDNTPTKNQPCTCGSNKKYKKCCMDKHQKIKDRKHALKMQVHFLNSLLKKASI